MTNVRYHTLYNYISLALQDFRSHVITLTHAGQPRALILECERPTMLISDD